MSENVLSKYIVIETEIKLIIFFLIIIHLFLSKRKPLIYALGDCLPVRVWSDSPITCLAELRMLWKDRNEQCLLAGLRLYFLPENTPLGRNCHGEVSELLLCIFDENVSYCSLRNNGFISVYSLIPGCLVLKTGILM
jgi:hypothetical protein